MADAHVQAADKLTPKSALAGSAYFITNREPRPFWGVMGDVCGGLGYARPHIHLPVLLVLAIAFLFEYVIRPLLKPFKELNSDFTVNRIKISTSYRQAWCCLFCCSWSSTAFGSFHGLCCGARCFTVNRINIPTSCRYVSYFSFVLCP